MAKKGKQSSYRPTIRRSEEYKARLSTTSELLASKLDALIGK